jgi:uncharacterized membrane protein
MGKLVKEIKDDVNFIRTHTLQPAWYKYLKIFILLGLIAAYGWFVGIAKTLVFLLVFLLLSFILHMVYRSGTHKFQQSWLDFKVVEEDGKVRAKSIGIFYYTAILINAVIAVLISHRLV